MSPPEFPSLDALLANAHFVRAAARGVLGGDAEVEDVVQETWLRAMDRQPREPGALRAWLRRIARNLALDAYRRRRARRAHETAAAAGEALPSVEAIAEREEARRRLVSVLLALEEPYRSAILLRYYEECPVAEVARRLGVPLETARTRLRRGLERLRERMGVGVDGSRGRWAVALLPWADPPRGGVPLVPLGGVAVKKLAAVLVACLLLVGGGVSWHLWGGRGSGDGEHALEAGALPGQAPETPDSGPLLAGNAGAGSLPPPVDLDACDRDLDLHGVVVRADGTPVAGANLQLGSYPWRRTSLPLYAPYFVWSDGPSTRSARDGTFSLRLRRGERVVVRATAADLAPAERRGCTAGQRLRLVMASGVTCIVALTGEAGQSVAGTPVRVFSVEQFSGPTFDRRTMAASDGRARFEGLPAGAALRVETEPVLLGSVAWKRIDLPPHGEITVEMALPIGRVVRGRVTDAVSGAPIARARVGIGWVLHRAVLTDAEGHYEVPGWNDAQGSNDLHVEAEGYGRQDAVVGARESIDFALDLGDVVAGRVVDGGGRPIAGVRVGTVGIGKSSGRSGGDTGRATESGPDGRFRITSLRRDQEHAVVFLADGFGRYVLDVAPRADGPGTIEMGDVALPAARRLEGRIVDGAEQGVADVRVGIRGANVDRRTRIGTLDPGPPAHYGQSEDTLTDDLGRFRFSDLPAGSYTVRVRPQGRAEVVGTFEVPADRDVLDAVLVVPSARELVVRVLTDAKAPIPGASVQANGPSAVTDSRGEARLFLPPGPASLSVFGPASERRFLSVQGRSVAQDAREIELVLLEAERISGTVQGPDGAAVAHALLFVSAEGLADVRLQADAQGAFSVEVPKGARVDVRVAGRTEPGPYGPQTLVPLSAILRQVSAGTTGVKLVAQPVARERSLRVSVRSPAGDPVAHVMVQMRTRDGVERHAMADEGGRATVDQLTAEPWSVLVFPSSLHAAEWLPLRQEGVVPDGQELTYVFRVGVRVGGLVLAPDGKAAPGARVRLAHGKQEQSTQLAFCDSEGRFTLLVDPQGALPLVLSVTQEAVLTSAARLELPTLPGEEVVVRLAAPGPAR